jgi:hypothetical protein
VLVIKLRVGSAPGQLISAALFLGSFLTYPLGGGGVDDGQGGGASVCWALGRAVLSTALGLGAMVAKEPGVMVLGLNV